MSAAGVSAKVKANISSIGGVFVWRRCTDKKNDGGQKGRQEKEVMGGVKGGNTHLIDCWVRFVRERWTECGRKSKVSVCLSLSWRKSQQSGTGSSRPGGNTAGRKREEEIREALRYRVATTDISSVNAAHPVLLTVPFCRGCGGLGTATCCSGPAMLPSPL